MIKNTYYPRGGSRGRVQGVRTPPPLDDLRFPNTTGILQKKTMWFIVEVEQYNRSRNRKGRVHAVPWLSALF